MTHCKSCGAPIIWAKTPSGKSIPLDALPFAGGNLELRAGVVHYVTADMNAIDPRYRTHFATCKNAAQHRKKEG